DKKNIKLSMYRPFTKKYLFYQSEVVDRPGPLRNWFGEFNQLIYVTKGAKVGNFSSLITSFLPTEVMLGSSGTGFIKDIKDCSALLEYSNITDSGMRFFKLSAEDLIYYIYSILNSKEFLKKYSNDLSKELPRIPKVKNKEKYVEIGKKLADLHLNYEDIPAYDGVNIVFKSDNPSFKVKKMKHPKRGQLDTIIFNEDIMITDIPERAYEYVVNGKPAIEWIIDQYQVKKDKKSGIVDDPNEFSDNPKYIFNLLLSIINVSMQTMDLVESLPPLEIID